MSLVSPNQFLDAIRTAQLLDEASLNELRTRPEAIWGDVLSLARHAQERGWLTPYQAVELMEGRGDRLNLAGYRVFDRWEEGPYGTDYKALHPSLLQPVLVRQVRPEWLEPGDRPDDFVARAQSASVIHHPHLTSILDAGMHAGQPFVVLEFVDGCDLFHMVNEMGALPLGLACEYIRQTASALQAIHEKGQVHGEIHPFHLLLTPVKRATGSRGDVSIRPRPGATIKLAGFGLVPHRPALEDLSYSQSDRLGPVGFLPPERLTSGERTTAGDVYGLGASLFFLLTTRLVHPGTTDLEALGNMRAAAAPPLDSIRPDLPPEVVSLVGRLLDVTPYNRPGLEEIIATLLPHCEKLAAPIPQHVLVAQETFTQTAVPDALPVARNLDLTPEEEPSLYAEEVPIGSDQPLVEPMTDSQVHAHAQAGGLMPGIQPLESHHEDGLANFQHSRMGADTPMAPRPRTKPNKKNMVWLVAGLCLHMSAVLLLIGYLTNWFAFSSPSTTPEPKEERKENTRTKAKPKRN